MSAPRIRKTPKPSKVAGAFQTQSSKVVKPQTKFWGTKNPRYLRAIAAMLRRPIARQELDSVAGCANGPALVAALRDLGLTVQSDRIQFIDRDGKSCRPGVYSLTESDRRKLHKWMALRGGQQHGQ